HLGEAGAGERLLVSGETVGADGHVGRPGDRGDVAPALADEVLDRQAGAALVVDVHVRGAGGVERAPDHGDGYAGRRGGDGPRVPVVGTDQQATRVVAAVQARLDEREPVVGHRDHHHGDVVRGQLLGRAGDDPGVERVREEAVVVRAHDCGNCAYALRCG